MSKPIDTAALRAKLREYDQTLPRCTKRIVRVSNHAPDYVAEEERAEWDMRLSYPCSDVEGHEGQCREGRAVLGWPGFATLTALLDEVERLRGVNDDLRLMVDGLETAAHEERAAVVAWLRVAWGAVNLVSTEIVSAEIERGEHRREEEG